MSERFSQAEFDRRIALTRRAMEREGLDALFVTNPSNMNWLTGYDGWSFYVHQGVLLLPDGAPVWWGRRMDSFGARRTAWMSADYIRDYTDDYIQSDDLHPMETLAALFAEHGLASARIGVEKENYYFTARALEVLLEQMPQATFADATNTVNWQRTVKSDEELVVMRKAAAISTKMIEGVMERVEPGMAKNDLVAEIYRDAIQGVDGAWGDYPAIVPLVPSGEDATAAHLTWDGRPFETGEATFFELSGCHRRYHAPFCRTVFLGTPSDRVLRTEAALIEAIEAGLDAARPGNRAADIAIALKSTLLRHGIERPGRAGYAVGLSYPPDWGEHTVSIRENDQTILRPGMTFHFMPALWMEDWGLEITETILIKDDGPAECLCHYPRKLIVKP
ncbi:putative peptidase [Rhodobacteraceae bacterium THAF1]|uniref:M24 family metallopeptidase n=1 Tax=Palleronia sp. THAF1 TaxID=2587842 RepID=UPI000F3BD22A|nr:M24 family metallopeptidase [Palleronia sp. THAF1]QFU09492.1 putative peptidase [Palleronia sp. THAF1]VDC21828.1 putative peptidase [Rhodobacteraceae bacterium THAF1]